MIVEERSIKDYMVPLRKHLLAVALLTVAAALLGVLLAVLTFGNSPYVGQATVLFKPGGSTGGLSFTGDGDVVVDPSRQQRSIEVLVSTLEIARRVHDRAAQEADPEVKALANLDLRRLRDSISVDTANRGDLIVLSAKASTPEAATWLANTWMEESVDKINNTYSVQSENVTSALDQAEADLQASQKAVRDFIATNPTARLNQELNQIEAFITKATGSSVTSLFALYDRDRDLINERVSSYRGYLLNLDQQLVELGALRSRIESSPDDRESLYSNQLALLYALNRLNSGIPGPQVQIQLNSSSTTASTMSKATQLQDIDATTEAVQKLQGDVRSLLAELEQKLTEPVPDAPANLEAVPQVIQDQIKRRIELQGQLEQLNFELEQLKKTRDLNSTTYNFLRNRIAEQQVNELIRSIVSVAARADVLETEESRSLLSHGVLWLLLTVLPVMLLGLAGGYLLGLLRPEWDTNAAITRRFRRQPAATPAPGAPGVPGVEAARLTPISVADLDFEEPLSASSPAPSVAAPEGNGSGAGASSASGNGAHGRARRPVSKRR